MKKIGGGGIRSKYSKMWVKIYRFSPFFLYPSNPPCMQKMEAEVDFKFADMLKSILNMMLINWQKTDIKIWGLKYWSDQRSGLDAESGNVPDGQAGAWARAPCSGKGSSGRNPRAPCGTARGGPPRGTTPPRGTGGARPTHAAEAMPWETLSPNRRALAWGSTCDGPPAPRTLLPEDCDPKLPPAKAKLWGPPPLPKEGWRKGGPCDARGPGDITAGPPPLAPPQRRCSTWMTIVRIVSKWSN